MRKAKSISLTALACACLCVISPFSIQIANLTFSFTLLAIYIICLVFDIKIALFSVVLYLLIGIVGLPVFAFFQGGVSVFVGVTGGYLVGYIPCCVIIGCAKIIFKDNKLAILISLVMGNLIVYILGCAWLFILFSYNATQLFLIGVAPYIVIDAIKIIIAYVIYLSFKKRKIV